MNIYGKDIMLTHEKEDYYITELRTQAEAAGIQTRCVIKGDTISPEYRKAVDDFKFAQTMLALANDDPRFVAALKASGLSSGQYRNALECSSAEAKKKIDALSADIVLPTNEFLSYVANRAKCAENHLITLSNMTEKPPVKKSRHRFSLPLKIAAILAVLVLLGIFLPLLPANENSDASSSHNVEPSSPSREFTYAAFLSGVNYHKYTCDYFNNKDLSSSDLIIYEGLLDARASGKTPCPSCIKDDDQAVSTSHFTPSIAPDSGTIIDDTTPGDLIAPFEIKTSGSEDYFIKLENKFDADEYITIYVHGGDTVEVDVPIGTYYMKYASGKTWYGKYHLFGADTSCEKADDLFEFYIDGDYVKGHTVTLYPVSGGNMDTEIIDVSDF